MLTDTQRENVYRHAARAKSEENAGSWRFAVYAHATQGSYQDLADYIGGISPDKVETAAHAWELYRSLRREYGAVVGAIRRLPYVYLSHFSTLHKLQRKYDLDSEVVFDYLMQVFQARGAISTRDLRTHVDNDLGAERALPYEAGKAHSALYRLLTRGDLATPDRKLFALALERLEVLRG